MNWSEYQTAIFEEVQNGSSNIVVNAKAGASKTTSLVESINRLDCQKILCVAFNKKIAESLRERVPSSIDVKTFHALGLAALKRGFPNAKMDNFKVANHAGDFFDSIGIKFRGKEGYAEKRKLFSKIEKICDRLRFNMVLNTKGLKNTIDELAYHLEIDLEEQELNWCVRVYKNLIKDVKTYDFVDMLYIPIKHNLKFNKYNFVFTDEGQDISFIQKTISLNSVAPNGRFMVVLDPSQTIYSFMGADNSSYKTFLSQPNTIELPLNVCYRCGREIIKRAQNIVPEIEWFEGCGEGRVVDNGSVENIKSGDTVLCRTNFPLVSLACFLLNKGTKVIMKNGDMSKSLISLIEETKEEAVSAMMIKLRGKLNKLRSELEKEHKNVEPERHTKFQALDEKIRSLDILAGETTNRIETTAKLIKKIEGIFSNNNEGVTLSTIHSFKGLESDRVFIIEPQLIPFPYYDREEDKQAERNLEYVAITRAKHHLEYVRDWTAFESKEKAAGKNGKEPKVEKTSMGDQILLDFDS